MLPGGEGKKLIGNEPEKGDIFLLCDNKTPPEYHTGFVTEKQGSSYGFYTIEGNAFPDDEVGNNGYGIFEKFRVNREEYNCYYKFVKWWKVID